MAALLFKDLGGMDYLEALALQERLLAAKKNDGLADLLLFVEHPHVFTLGRGGAESNVIAPGEVPLYRTSRGGDVTYHGPGQLVVYPLLDLKSKLRRDVHRYLRNLEAAAIAALGGFGLEAERKPPWTGVWIGERKIASIGVAVRTGITYHGLALNVNPDLSYFERVIPCGLAWAEMTSMEKELGRRPPMSEVKQAFLRRFARKFHYTEVKELCHDCIRTGSESGPREARTTSLSSGL